MNHNPVNQCASPACSIYQYRAAVRGNLHVDFLPVLSQKGRIDDNGGDISNKTVLNGGAKNENRRNVNSDDFKRVV
jgi:hypothetical protein